VGRVLIAGAFFVLGSAPSSAQMGGNTYTYVAFDELELATSPEARPVVFDGEAWWGGDFDRLWLKLAGEVGTEDGLREAEVAAQALYSRAVTPFWNFQTGIRVDHVTGDGGATRPRLAVGFEGLARYWFEVEAFAFVGEDGDVTGSLEASYDILLGQRLILEPEVEISVASETIPEFGLGSGFTEGEVGFRLRYEIRREFAPYVGWSWERAFGDTADLLEARGEDTTEGTFVVGLRWWY
jgi:copper resistance protein B